jgi:Rod binding domain-containing protein
MLPPPAALDAPLERRMNVAEAAREFETAFLVELLKSARQAGEPLAEPSEVTGSENYQEFAERYLAQELARRNAFGFAKVIERELLKPDASQADKQLGRAES